LKHLVKDRAHSRTLGEKQYSKRKIGNWPQTKRSLIYCPY